MSLLEEINDMQGDDFDQQYVDAEEQRRLRLEMIGREMDDEEAGDHERSQINGNGAKKGRENMPVSIVKKYNLPNEIAVLKLYVNTYYDLQNHRIKAGNRIFALSEFNGVDPDIAKRLTVRLIGGKEEGVKHQGLMDVEVAVAKDIQKLVFQHDLWKRWLVDIKGIGPVLAGGWSSSIGTISRFDTISKLWAYSGYHTVPANQAYIDRFKNAPHIAQALARGATVGDPNEMNLRMAPRRTRGQQANWSSFMRTLGWKTAESFIRTKASDGQYRAYYDQVKARLMITHPAEAGYTDAHRHAMAKRKVVKLFLAHLYKVWRSIDGLPIRPPYVEEKLGHTTIIEPFNW